MKTNSFTGDITYSFFYILLILTSFYVSILGKAVCASAPDEEGRQKQIKTLHACLNPFCANIYASVRMNLLYLTLI